MATVIAFIAVSTLGLQGVAQKTIIVCHDCYLKTETSAKLKLNCLDNLTTAMYITKLSEMFCLQM